MLDLATTTHAEPTTTKIDLKAYHAPVFWKRIKSAIQSLGSIIRSSSPARTVKILTSPSRRIPQLPIEVWEIIIDFVAVNKHPGVASWRATYPHLLACALTCKGFTYRSLLHIARAWKILEAEDADPTLLRIQRRHEAKLDHDAFFIFCPSDVSGDGEGHKPPPWISSVPIRFSFAMKTLDYVHIQDVDFTYTHPTFLAAFGLARSITTLFLSDSTFSTYASFQRLLCAFPRLTQVTLSELEVPEAEGEGTWARSHAHLSRISLQHLSPFLAKELFKWIQSHQSTSLRHFAFTGAWTAEIAQTLAATLASCSGLVAHYLGLAPDLQNERLEIKDHLSHLNLKSNTRLQYLVILIKQEDAVIPLFPSICKLLSTTFAFQEILIELILPLSDPCKVSLIQWKLLNDYFKSRPCMFKIVVSGGERTGLLLRSFNSRWITEEPFLTEFVNAAEMEMPDLCAREVIMC